MIIHSNAPRNLASRAVKDVYTGCTFQTLACKYAALDSATYLLGYVMLLISLPLTFPLECLFSYVTWENVVVTPQTSVSAEASLGGNLADTVDI